MFKAALLLISITLLTGCSSKKSLTYNTDRVKTEHQVTQPPYKPKSKNWITTSLYKEYKKWYKTPFRLGGMTQDGVDCSGLIHTIYKDAFGIEIPRTTREQVLRGHKISKNSTKEGDLVFFKTGYNKRHIGIIIEEGKFIHTSQKNGVIVSQLSNPYWQSTYWQSRRILPE